MQMKKTDFLSIKRSEIIEKYQLKMAGQTAPKDGDGWTLDLLKILELKARPS